MLDAAHILGLNPSKADMKSFCDRAKRKIYREEDLLALTRVIDPVECVELPDPPTLSRGRAVLLGGHRGAVRSMVEP